MLDYYIANIKLLWPHSQFRYSEDAALHYLVQHGYDVEMALAELVVNVDVLGRKLNQQDIHLLTVLKGNVKLDKDIEHSFFSTRRGKSEKKSVI